MREIKTKSFNLLLIFELVFIGLANNVAAMNEDVDFNEKKDINIRNKIIVNFFENKMGVSSELAYNNILAKVSWGL